MLFTIHKFLTVVEEIHHDLGLAPERPAMKGAVGARLDVPITHLEWSYVGSHYDAIDVGVPDGPRADELVVILAMVVADAVAELQEQ